MAETGRNSVLSVKLNCSTNMSDLLQKFEMIDRTMAEILRHKTEVERLRIAGRIWKSARVIVRGAIRTEHPEWTDQQVNHEIARRMSHGAVK